MKKIMVTLHNGEKRSYSVGTKISEILEDLQVEGKNKILAAKADGYLVDLAHPIEENTTLSFFSFEDEEGKEVYNHSTSHLMAQSVQELYPEAKITIGPPIENGFYYDFYHSTPFTPEDLKKIEKKMKHNARKNLPITRLEMSKKEAIKLFKERGEQYKVEILEEIEDDRVSCYSQGEYIDLCRGPHVPSTGRINAFKLLSVAGAYWRGDERREMLQRIYGTSFETDAELKSYLERLEEAKRRDHRILGKKLDLYSVHDKIGGGLIHWHPKGTVVKNIIEDFWQKEHYSKGYEIVSTPHIASEEIYRISGHLENYSDLMYSSLEVEGRPFRLKPMNCPGHIMIYKNHLHSYRELPIRYAEMGTVYRFERSGVLHGLLRVRGFTIDDAHIFCQPFQVEDEVISVINFSIDFWKNFGFTEYDVYIATRPEKSVGREEDWAKATKALEAAAQKANLSYKIDEGGGAFYGPKIDLKIKDSLGRSWQMTTIQFDFNLPERFDLSYINEEGKEARPFMIHRAILGSLERFFAVLIEHYGGDFPLWLAPIQARIMTVTQTSDQFAQDVFDKLKKAGIRVRLDLRNEKIGFKIREAEEEKIPYMIVIGKREVEEKTLSIRARKKGDLGKSSPDEFIKITKEKLNSRI
jgi:threonyl-tRNA synthetase